MSLRSAAHSSPGSGRRRLLVRLCTGLVLLMALVGSVASLALAASPWFPDVPATHPNYVAIVNLAYQGIINGYDNGNFGPGDDVMRQQFAKMIVLTMDHQVPPDIVCPFDDVDQTPNAVDPLYPAKYVATCALHGITLGKTPTTFDPYASITRFQVLTMVVRAVDELHPGLLATPPGDFEPTWNPGLSPEHGDNAARAEYNGLLAGIDLDGLDPLGNMTRAEVAQVLYNVLAKLTSTTTTTTNPSSTTTTYCPP